MRTGAKISDQNDLNFIVWLEKSPCYNCVVRAHLFLLTTVFLPAADLTVDHVSVAGKDLKQMQAQLAAVGIPTEFGGTFGNGALCKVVGTVEKVVHSFSSDVDGANPAASGTIVKVFDRNFYELLADLLVGGTDDNGPAQGTIVVFIIGM